MSQENSAALQTAAQFIKQGEIKRARDILRDVIQRDPNSADAWFLVSYAVDTTEQAIDALKRAVSISSEHTLAARRLAELQAVASHAVHPLTINIDGAPQPQSPSKTTSLAKQLIALALLFAVIPVGIGLLIRSNALNTGNAAAELAAQASAAPLSRCRTLINTVLPTLVPPNRHMTNPTPIPRNEVTKFPSDTWASLLASDNQTLVYSQNSYRDEIYVAQGDSFESIKLSNTDWRDFSPTWSPDGRRLVYVSTPGNHYQQSALYLLDANTPTPVRITDNAVAPLHPQWSPNSRLIAFADISAGLYDRDVSRLVVIDAEVLTRPCLISESALDPRDFYINGPFQWSPDSSMITYPDSEGIRIKSADGSGDINDFLRNGAFPAWSPDGKYLGFVCPSEQNTGKYFQGVCIASRSFGEWTRKVLPIPPRDYITIVWSPDSTRLVAHGMSEELVVVDIASLEWDTIKPDQGLSQLGLPSFPFEFQGDPSLPIWSPDSRYIYFVGGRGHIFRADANGNNLTLLRNTKQTIRNISLSSDGSLLAYSASDGQETRLSVFKLNGNSVALYYFPEASPNYPVWRP